MKICVYDLSSSYEVRVVDSDTKSELLTYRMPPALITDDFFHNNSKCSMFNPATQSRAVATFKKNNSKCSMLNPATPDFSAFIKMNEGDKFCYSYDNSKLLILTEIIYSLCWDPSSKNVISLAEKYFKAVRSLVNGGLKRNSITVGMTILLVPDALPLESQQRLLACFGRNKTRLLWHSIAVSLGNEEYLGKCDDEAKVAIVDEFSNIGLFTSKIGIKFEDGRAIPCHKIYKRADGKISSWFLARQEEEIHRALFSNVKYDRLKAAYGLYKESDYVDIDRFSGLPVKRNVGKPSPFKPIKIQNAALVISSERSTVYGLTKRENVIKCNIAESGFTGALKFFEYVRNGQIPYYDECESFSVICQNKKEEIEYFELIKANAYLPGGTVTKGEEIGNLCILKGSKNAQFKFHLGDVRDSNAQLRQYTQEFPIEKPLEEDRALLLSPSVIPGQGFAQVIIEDNNQDKLFPPIELDWNHMELALDNGVMVTKAYLEKHLERSFPPDVPPVRSRYIKESADSLESDFHRLFKQGPSDEVFYRRSRWPYIADKDVGVEKFTRENTFGHYTKKYKHAYAFPVKGLSISGQEFLDEFEDLAKKFVESKGNNSSYVTWLAWCYQRYDLQGELLPWMKKATDLIIRSIDNSPKYPLKAQTASYIANMIATEKEFERVFCVFDRMLLFKKEGINNWCRAIYQMLMYTPYIYADNKKIANAAVSVMSNLTMALKYATMPFSPSRVYMTLRVVLYMLRRRICEKNFCKKDSSDGLYDKVVDALDCVKSNLRFCPSYKAGFIDDIIRSIRQFLDGKGVLDGIPAPDLNDDGVSDDE